jgi:hypothetical protein
VRTEELAHEEDHRLAEGHAIELEQIRLGRPVGRL